MMSFKVLAFLVGLPSLATAVTFNAGSSNVRRLGKHEIVEPNQVRSLCDGTTTYAAFLQVFDVHLLVVAKSANEDCPALVFHANADMKKELITIEDWGPEDSLFKLDEYSLEELLQAYEQVQTSNSVWEMVTNNCASFVLDIFCYMGYVPTSEIFDWTIERLVVTEESTSFMTDALRQSSHLADLPMVTDGSPLEERQKDVVAELVYYYAAKNEGSCVSKQKNLNTRDSGKERALTIGLVVESIVWFMIAFTCYFIGRSVGKKNATPRVGEKHGNEHVMA